MPHEGCYLPAAKCPSPAHEDDEPTCSCPTDAEIRAAIHHSHQQLTGGNND